MAAGAVLHVHPLYPLYPPYPTDLLTYLTYPVTAPTAADDTMRAYFAITPV
jgi:hypothetical protein